MDKKLKDHSLDEVKQKMEKYLDLSQERLRKNLRQAWKKQGIKIKAYDSIKI